MPTAKTSRAAPQRIYQLTLELRHIEPRIWRTLLVPENITLTKLDRVIQAAMGWTNSHLHQWHIAGQCFKIPDPDFDSPGTYVDERKCTLAQALSGDAKEFMYEYDFGDGWEHRINVDRTLPLDAQYNAWPMCIDGANACPPEDCGGPPGYIDFVQAMTDPLHAEHRAMWKWHGGPFSPTAFSLNDANRAIRRLR